MKRTREIRKKTSAEGIARLADRGKDVSRFFTNSGRMMEPIRRVNVDFASPMLKELDRTAAELNISPRTVKQHLRTLFLRAGIKQGRKRVILATAIFEKEQLTHVAS